MPFEDNPVYYCVNCGERLTRDDLLYDISAIIFYGAREEDYAGLHVLIDGDTLQLMANQTVTGYAHLTAENAIKLLYLQQQNNLDVNTVATDGSAAYLQYKAEIEKAQDGVPAGPGGPQVPGLSKALSERIRNNFPAGENGLCLFRLRLDDSYGYRFKMLGQDREQIEDFRRCGKCRSTLLSEAFRHPHILIGIVGFQKVGKTCLIAALCDELCRRGNGELLLRAGDNRFRMQMERFRNGFELDKTASDGTNVTNPTILLADENMGGLMLTFADISGESFNNEDGVFDPGMMVNNFKAITNCSLYIFCAALSTFEEAQYGEMHLSFRSFISHITNATQKMPPSMLALLQIDEQVRGGAARSAGSGAIHQEYLFEKEYRQIDNLAYSADLQARYGPQLQAFAERMVSLRQFLSSMMYLTPITCSAYGRQPVKETALVHETDKLYETVLNSVDEDVADGRQIRVVAPDDAVFAHCKEKNWPEDAVELVHRDSIREIPYSASPIRFTSQPRNLGSISNWVRYMIGRKRIPARLQDEAALAPLDCCDLSIFEYHFESDDEVRAVARLFCNPHEYDKEAYRLLGGGLSATISSRRLAKMIENRRNAGLSPLE